MHPLPHRYVVTTVVGSNPEIILESKGLPPLRTALPAEFGGAGDRWSPETLLVGAVADCYALTFRGLAARSKVEWTSLALDVTGTLDRIDHVTKFVEFHLNVRLRVPGDASETTANRLLVKAEETCLITRSMSARTYLNASVEKLTASMA